MSGVAAAATDANALCGRGGGRNGLCYPLRGWQRRGRGVIGWTEQIGAKAAPRRGTRATERTSIGTDLLIKEDRITDSGEDLARPLCG